MKTHTILPKFLILLILFTGCNPKPQVAEADASQKFEMVNPVIKREPKDFRQELTYSIDSLKSKQDVDSLLNRYSEKELHAILALNRMDRNRLRPNTNLVIPECAASDFLDYSPLPSNIDFMACIPKAVLVSQRVQAFGLYENGELVQWGPVSTGKRSTRTPNGLNYGNYKARKKISTVDASWVMPYYFNFMNHEGIGTHQYALPGYPASHGCVRMYMDDAKDIYNWASMWELNKGKISKNGTPFIVYGEYDYNSDKPWYNLAENMKANDMTEEEVKLLKDYIWNYQHDPRNFETQLDTEEGMLASAQ